MSTTTATPNLPRELRAPRVPKREPVIVTYVCTINTPSGNPRRGWIVRSINGEIVETIEEGYTGLSALTSRWPWFDYRQRERFNLGSVYPSVVRIDVMPGHWRELMSSPGSNSHEATRLRKLGDKCERFTAVAEAVSHIRRDGTGVDKFDNTPRSAVVYFRKTDTTGPTVKRAMNALVRSGMAIRTDDPSQVMRDGKTRVGDVYGHYRATDTTPLI